MSRARQIAGTNYTMRARGRAAALGSPVTYPVPELKPFTMIAGKDDDTIGYSAGNFGIINPEPFNARYAVWGIFNSGAGFRFAFHTINEDVMTALSGKHVHVDDVAYPGEWHFDKGQIHYLLDNPGEAPEFVDEGEYAIEIKEPVE